MTPEQAKANLQQLIDRYHLLSAAQRDELGEQTIIGSFILPLLREVLGWPTDDPAHVQREVRTATGRADLVFRPAPDHSKVYLEAKAFSRIKDLDLPQIKQDMRNFLTFDDLPQTAMWTDRTKEEQQAINYAFESGGTWAILTNFQKLRLYNARRDTLVLAFESPAAYLDEFEALWDLSYERILQGSLEALSRQRYRLDVDEEYLKLIDTWRLKLAQDIIRNRAVNGWAFYPDGAINFPVLRGVVQRLIDRLVIVRFAEDHFVVKAGTLQRFHEFTNGWEHYTQKIYELLNHFFERFNALHNSALFASSAVDFAVFSNPVLTELIDGLYRARYRSMPADIIGNTYEQYLGKRLALNSKGEVDNLDNLETRKKQGSYYTPQVIVRYIVDQSLGRYLYGTDDGTPDGTPLPDMTRKTSADITTLRVLDSACGSGSFLIYAYEVLAGFYAGEQQRLTETINATIEEMTRQRANEVDIRLKLAPLQQQHEALNDYPRRILETHLYGVDLDPQAAEIAVVNLIMRAMESRGTDKLLPLILNQNVKVGNSLVGMAPHDARLADFAADLANLRQWRADLLHTPHNSPEHAALIEQIEQGTAALTHTLNEALSLDQHFTDLDRVRPFHWAVEFPEVFIDADGNPLPNAGFDVIIGNPPWEILKPELREYFAQFDDQIESKLTRREVESRIEQLIEENPHVQAEWDGTKTYIEQSAAYFSASPAYTRQGRGDRATHKLFIERSYSLLHDGGRLGYVVPSGIYTDLGTKELREMLLNDGHIHVAVSLSNAPAFFKGVHRSFKFTLMVAHKSEPADSFRAVFRYDPRTVPSPETLPAFLRDAANFVTMNKATLSRFSPDSLSVMEFASARDYQIAEKIYNSWPLMGETVDDLWNMRLTAEFHLTNDRKLFNTVAKGLPLYEGKMFHQFDAFYSRPQYWIEESQGANKLASRPYCDYGRPRLVYRDVARATDERTLIAAIVPPNVFVGNTGIVETQTDNAEMLYLLAILNSFCEDYIIRHKVSTHVSMFYAYQLPLPRLTAGHPTFDAIVERAARLTCTRAEYADLWQAVMGRAWQPRDGATDPAERQRLRDELDGLVAHLYGLTRNEYAHILGTFPLVFPDTAEGRARRSQVLAVYDYMGQTLVG